MWPTTFEQRLASWTCLRKEVTHLPLDQTLSRINAWWFKTPWRAYHLHWDDQLDWPDPWQLLSDNIYCNLARGLGILYTLSMLDRSDLQDAVLAEVDSNNLVLVNKEKYILNWDSDIVVNNNPGQLNYQHSIAQAQIKQQLR